MATPGPNELVTKLAAALKPPEVSSIAAEDALALAPDLPELVTFFGFLGGEVKQPGGGSWRLLYLDLRLQTWLLVESIVYATQIKDEYVPGEKVDVIWVRADAPVRRGSGSQPLESRFLSGNFTRAGDFDAPLTGGTMAAATGVFCAARTPLCCNRHSR